MKGISEEIINLTSPHYKLKNLLSDLRNNIKRYKGMDEKELIQTIYNEMSAYEQIDKILKTDSSLEDKVKTLMPSYNLEVKTILENIQKNELIMAEIDKEIPLDKKLSNLVSDKKESKAIDTRDEEIIS